LLENLKNLGFFEAIFQPCAHRRSYRYSRSSLIGGVEMGDRSRVCCLLQVLHRFLSNNLPRPTQPGHPSLNAQWVLAMITLIFGDTGLKWRDLRNNVSC